VLEEFSAQFKRDDERFRELRRDLKSLELNLKASKRFLREYKKALNSRGVTKN
jgi:hypothetical protein